MSHALNYPEPYRVPAGLLALVVHVAFVALLVLGVRWQSQPPVDYSVELWDSLPVAEPVPEPTPPAPEAPAVSKAEPPAPAKADIELREKKVVKAEPSKPSAQEIKAKREAEERQLLEEYAEKQRQKEQDRVRAEMSAATAAEVGRYTDMIRRKIQRSIKGRWVDLPQNTVVVYRVTLLPDGTVMGEPELLKGSGFTAFDEAVVRAIPLAQPLPLPTDPALKREFRSFRLTIRPSEN